MYYIFYRILPDFTVYLDLETDISKADRENNIEFFNSNKNNPTNIDKVEEKYKDKVRDKDKSQHITSNCSSSKVRSGWLPELMISTPPLSHSLSTSCLSNMNYPHSSSQEYLFSKSREELTFNSNREKGDGANNFDDHFYTGKKRGPNSVTATSFSSNGTSIQSPEMYQNQCLIIQTLLSHDLDVVEVKDDDEEVAVLNRLPSNNSGSAPASLCGLDDIEKGFDILVVDDSKLNRKMLCKVLRSKGHVCDEADDGLKAVLKVKERMMRGNSGEKRYFDAILMDFVMPCMDGPTGT